MPIYLAYKKYFIVGLWWETQNKDSAHCNINFNQKQHFSNVTRAFG